MEYTDPTNPTSTTPIGFDIDMLNALSGKLNRPVNATVYDFGGLIPAMQSGRCDIIAAGMFATPVREQVVDFVRYMKAGTAFLVQKGNPKNVKSFDDLCGTKAGYNLGSVYEQTIKDQSTKCQAAGKAPVQGVLYQGDQGQITALQNGQLDVAFRDSTAAKYIAAHATGVDVGGVQFTSDTFGLALPKGSTDLKTQISGFIRGWQSDGTFAGWLSKWQLPSENRTAANRYPIVA